MVQVLDREDQFSCLEGTGRIARPALTARLFASVLSNRLVTLVAPAGCGKSVLLAQVVRAAAEQGVGAAWVACTASCRDVSFLARQINDALGSCDIPRGGFDRLDHLAKRLVAAGRETIVVLDDYHLCDCEGVNDALAFLIQSTRANVHFVLSSRSGPHISTAALRMQGKFEEFSRVDLAIRPDEVETFIAAPPGSLSSQDISRILEHTDGWAAALQFVRLLVAERADLRAVLDDLSAADENVKLYLYEEVFRGLPSELQDYLLTVAPFGRFSADLTAAVGGIAGAHALHRELVERNLFVVPLDRQGRWLQLHSVFRECLVDQALRERGELVQAQLIKAAHWHWRNQRWLEVINNIIDAGEMRLAVQWLSACSDEIVMRKGDLIGFRACCERIAAEYFEDTDLIIWMVWAAAFSKSSTEASGLLARHVEALERSGTSPGRVLVLRALITYFSHDFDGAVALACRFARGQAEGTAFDRASMAALMILALKSTLQRTKALPWLETARRHVSEASSLYARAWLHALSAFLAVLGGRPQSARDEIRAVLSNSEFDTPMMRGIVGPVLAEACYELNDFSGAEQALHGVGDIIEQCGPLDTALPAYRVRAMLMLRSAGPEAALSLLENWHGAAHRRYGERAVAFLRLFMRDIILHASDEKRGELEAQFPIHVGLSELLEGAPDLREKGRIQDSLALLQSGRPREAVNEIRHVVLSARNDGRYLAWTEGNLIRAAAEYAYGEERKAERTLIECLSKVAPLGIRRTILDQARVLRPFAPFLNRYVRNSLGVSGDIAAVIHALLDELGESRAPVEEQEEISPVERLTPQEGRILSLLAEGLANADIGDRLVLSLPTVKWHIYNMYQKLGVRSRTAAVRRGRVLGMIS